jgi:uncharacterized protein (DUF952 family)
MAELETAVREHCRIVLLVFDNRRYGTIRMHQAQRGTGVGVGTELGSLDVVKIAEGFGARGVRVDDDRGFEEVLREALLADGPTVIHLPLDRRWVSIDDNPGKVDALPVPAQDAAAAETPASAPDTASPLTETVSPAPETAAPPSDAAALITYHLVAAETWDAVGPGADYEPASLAAEGFVHCTDGVAGLRASGDRYYRDDPRPFLVASIDLGRLGGAWRYDDEDRRFPHIYRPIPRDAVIRVVPIPRAEDGSFLGFPA